MEDKDFDKETRELIDEILRQTEDAKNTPQKVSSDIPFIQVILFGIIMFLMMMFIYDKVMCSGQLIQLIAGLLA